MESQGSMRENSTTKIHCAQQIEGDRVFKQERRKRRSFNKFCNFIIIIIASGEEGKRRAPYAQNF